MPRKVVITGVTRGLGRSMVERFIESDCVIRGCGRSTKAINSLQASAGPPHDFAVVDVAQDAEVAGWAERLLGEGFVPDLLINNAALMNEPAALWDVPPEEFAALMSVNVTGTYHVIRHFVPAMIKREQGVIVNFSSGWGRSVSSEVAPYCATKWAVEGLTQALAQELPSSMAAVPLNPGVIDTDMLRRCWGPSADGFPTAEDWSRRALPFLLSLGASDNGRPVTVP